MTYNIRPTSKFQKDLKRIQKRGYNIALLTDVIKKLAVGEKLPEKNRDHSLSGNFARCRECHIAPDWLLIYEINNNELILYLTRKGATVICFKDAVPDEKKLEQDNRKNNI